MDRPENDLLFHREDTADFAEPQMTQTAQMTRIFQKPIRDIRQICGRKTSAVAVLPRAGQMSFSTPVLSPMRSAFTPILSNIDM